MNQPNTFRPEIQGLRAIAVLAVLLFHIWPTAVPGGYVGVDVFFVISGYLITGLLLREAERDGRISIGRFYARRIKRLLPAATIVLLAVTTCISILPVVRWEDTAFETIASALYFENWWLAKNAVDYLASEQAPSALQHFWSLSVEEQYYIAWPILLTLSAWILPAFRRRPRFTFGVLVAVIGCLSLAYSIYITPRNPGLAYFATTTRGWELAIGGALAVWTSWQKLPGSIRLLAGYLGVLLIVLVTWMFSTSTSFPGYMAILPTVGAALVIVSGRSGNRLAIYGVLKSRLFQYVGDLSYSLYLWHWPVVVFYIALAGRPVGLIDGLIVFGVSMALAHQTKYLIEDRFRAPEFATSRRWMPFAFGVLCILSSIVFAGTVLYQFGRHSGGVSENIAASGDSRKLGSFHPALADARQDIPVVYGNGCHIDQRNEQPRSCSWGSPAAATRVVLVGDSHAAQWLPALREIAKKRNWQLTSFTKSACGLADVELTVGRDKRAYTSCAAWGKNVTRKIIEMKPDMVIATQSRGQYAFGASNRTESNRKIVGGLSRTWRAFEGAGIRLVALADTPRMRIDVPDCLSSAKGSIKACSQSLVKARSVADPVAIAAKQDGVPLVDMTDTICGPKTCAPVIRDMLVWRDSHHLTATYARSLASKLAKRLDRTSGLKE